jgi:hypothetical protein
VIARIRFSRGGEPCEAVMNDDGTWESSDAQAGEYLNLFHAARDSSPADGEPGRRQAMEAAQALGGSAAFPEDGGGEEGGEEEPERVY